MITNGDLAPGFFNESTGDAIRRSVTDAGVPAEVVPADDSRTVLRYYNHKVRSAIYAA